ncbi:MAG: penicillin-binding protein 2 [Chitinivibrionales bacterium]|nr:penicillin-binding protein 2 [Chitinivibrionales bacterium]
MSRGSIIQDDQQERLFKSVVLSIGSAALIAVLILRLFVIQVVQADVNIKLSKENRMQLKIIKAPRGRIFDRYGKALARNRPSYSLSILPYQMKQEDSLVTNLLKITNTKGVRIFDSTNLVKRLHKAKYRRFDATRIKEDVSLEIVSIIEEHALDFPGLIVLIESRREYPLGPAAFHVLGYMSEIPETQYDSLKEVGYYYGDLIGKAGIEKQYETLFRGVDGQEYIEVNAYGKRLGAIENMPRREPQPGQDLYLTIDAGLQQVAFDAFPDTLKGAVVVTDPRNGQVLVMISSPSVNPNIFSLASSLRSKQWASVALDPRLPLNNRATFGTYPPGSTFKLITALAGLECGEIQPSSRMPVSCRGAFRIGSRIARCWKASGHGSFRLHDALKHSCNVYFYQLGLRLGDDNINTYAHQFGLGEPTEIDLPREDNGWLSGEQAYNERFSKRGWKWTRGLLLNMAIGQSQLVTPLQLSNMVGSIGNSRTIYKPYLLQESRGRDGVVVGQYAPRVKHAVSISEQTRQAVHAAMKSTVDRGGTGWRAGVKGIPVGGKTGSAENPHGEKTHALFAACAPVYDPVIAVAVVVENAGHGGSVAAPIAGKVLNHFFEHNEEGKRLVEEYAELDRNKR